MIEGLRLAFAGAEIIRAIDDRIDEHHASIQFKRDDARRLNREVER